MFDVILALTISFAISYLAIPVIIRVAAMKKLFDLPDERKVHRAPIPSLGGLGIFAGFSFSTLLIVHFNQALDIQYYLAAAIVIFFLGLKDDILVLSPVKKFIGQVLAAFIIIYKGNIAIDNLGGFLGIYHLPEPISLLFTYLTVIVIINSFNLIDGVDGLAGSLGLLSATVFGIYFLRVGQINDAVLAFALSGGLLSFLIFNFYPARIFMGDTGSLLIGVVNSVLVIKFINSASSPQSSWPIYAAPAIGFAILMVPLMDTVRVFTARILRRQSPFTPDRNHIHHLLLERGYSHRTISLLLLSLNALMIIGAFTGRQLGCTLLTLLMFVVFFSLIIFLYYSRNRKAKMLVSGSTALSAGPNTKIIPLAEESILQQK